MCLKAPDLQESIIISSLDSGLTGHSFSNCCSNARKESIFCSLQAWLATSDDMTIIRGANIPTRPAVGRP